MHILFLTHYFPPEVNAPASRTFENAKRWVAAGHKVTVLTCAPNHPRGVLYPGYKNRLFQWDTLEGIRILRVFTYLGPNAGFTRRVLNYLSYMLSATVFCPLVPESRYSRVYLAAVFLRDGGLMGQPVKKEALGAGNKRSLARKHHRRRAGDESHPDSLFGRIRDLFVQKRRSHSFCDAFI